MKKIKLTVASILLGGMSYAQCVSKTDLFCSCDSLTDREIAQVAYFYTANGLEETVLGLRAYIKSGDLPPELTQTYVDGLMSMLSKLEDINAGFIDCENCDEID